MNSCESAYSSVLKRIAAASAGAGRPAARLVAVGKKKPAEALRALAALGHAAFGENYVQEALAKQAVLADLALEWHAIGPLQSNKAREIALHFDWLQTLDRTKLVDLLARHRPGSRTALNVLIQVNIDDETSKSGCSPREIAALADAIRRQPALRLRGLMAIPAPRADFARRRDAFARMRELFDALAAEHPGIDTLSMGMSDDFELAIAQGATMVRIGTALFGARTHAA
ncbi:MAG TPA: YggS family pyridoxal phosphate-dependent enzyme [Rhodanobacteraceae bacterium]|jgi:pyridoxal phosphate enzyme (YggS family)|nr:YggS family pyridoxal phosphate-dependent enzyme [Rhodanobacteraceae bacterium]